MFVPYLECCPSDMRYVSEITPSPRWDNVGGSENFEDMFELSDGLLVSGIERRLSRVRPLMTFSAHAFARRDWDAK